MKHRKTSSCKSNKSNHTTSTDKDVKAADINGMLTPASSNYPPRNTASNSYYGGRRNSTKFNQLTSKDTIRSSPDHSSNQNLNGRMSAQGSSSRNSKTGG